MSDFEIKIHDAANHTSVKVKNLAESVKFYHEIMGLPIIRQIGPPENPRIVFLPGVELSQVSDGQSSDTPGFFAHIGIAVDNIEEACKRLEEHGVELEKPLREIVFEEMGQRLQLAFFKDPDGIAVEYVKWTPM